MYKNTYKLKDSIIYAYQYCGTSEEAEELAIQYNGLEYNDGVLYFDADYGYDEIKEDDFIIIENNRVVDIMDGDLFFKFYEKVD